MRINGVITRVASGDIKTGTRVGQQWQSITVEGIMLFVPAEMQNGYERGQRVKVEIAHQGDTVHELASGKKVFEPKYELLSVERVSVEA